ncbi:acyl carrier protein [Streptomyces sirii]|uniref:acyl carrier protein n=1 Tax=Streptomyces sirii TaxID=3127701 RepID=UPI003D368F7F
MTAPFSLLRRLLIEDFDIDPALVRPQATLTGLDMDSLTLVEFMVGIETELEIRLTEEQEASVRAESTLGTMAELFQDSAYAQLLDLLIEQHAIETERLSPKATFKELGIGPEKLKDLLALAEARLGAYRPEPATYPNEEVDLKEAAQFLEQRRRTRENATAPSGLVGGSA